MFFTAISTGFLTGAGLIVAIGAQNAYVLRQGLLRQHVGPVVTICAIGDIALILLGVAGAGVLVHEIPLVLSVFRYLGALFLSVYGAIAARRAFSGAGHLAAAAGGASGLKTALLTCLAFTFLNPHVYLDTMVLVGSLSTRYQGDLRWYFAGGACLSSLTWFCCLGFGARLLQPIFRNSNAWRILDALIAMFMFVLAILLAFHPLNT